MRTDVLIAGVDAAQSKSLEQDLRQTLADLRANDISTVALLPSDAQGRWDLGVKRNGGWSVVWFDAKVDELASHARATLRRSVE
jgi:hypothetical protein